MARIYHLKRLEKLEQKLAQKSGDGSAIRTPSQLIAKSIVDKMTDEEVRQGLCETGRHLLTIAHLYPQVELENLEESFDGLSEQYLTTVVIKFFHAVERKIVPASVFTYK